MILTRREQLREATFQEILTVARKQMAAKGAAALSLRAIAREMRMTAPAIYRYFENRDALVTALIVAAYNSLADTLEATCNPRGSEDLAGQWVSVGMAYWQWAMEHPQEYILIFGTPIPGYEAPKEQTTPPAQRALGVLIALIETAHRDGHLTLPAEYAPLSPELEEMLATWHARYQLNIPHPVLHLALSIWAHMHGLLTLQLFHHLDPLGMDPAALFRFEISALIRRLGLD